MEETVRPGLRILVGAGSFVDAAAALRIVARLPSDFLAGLGGILVEDIDTLATCQIPRQRVVSESGVMAMAPSLSQVRALLKADAGAFRQSLARAADPTGVNWVFAQDTGQLISTALRAAKGWDILVIGYRQVHQMPGKIVVFESAHPPQDAVMEVSDRLSKHLSVDRIVFAVAPEDNRTSSARRPEKVHFTSLDQALKALARTNAQAVLVDLAQGPIHTLDDLARLLEAARCPLIVFGTSGVNTRLEHSTQIPPSPSEKGRNTAS